MNNRRAIIIGAGVAGLSAGCYLRMNGYTTEIFEAGKSPGGLCTSWKRHGYVFDGCIRWLVGANPDSGFYRIWRELGAVQGREFVYFDKLYRFEGKDGESLTLFTDPARLEQELRRASPGDGAAIRHLTGAVRRFARVAAGRPAGKRTFLDGIRFLFAAVPLAVPFLAFKNSSLGEYARRFKSPLIRAALCAWDERISALALVMTLAWLHRRAAGYPKGGSLEFARAIERRYLALGGEINYDSRVIRILIENDIAYGVELENGTRYHADVVVSAADGYSTIFKLLGGGYTDKKIVSAYTGAEIFPAILQVSLGVAREFPDAPHALELLLERPIAVDDKTRAERVSVTVYNFDPSLAPPGKTALTVIMPAEYEYWVNLRNNSPRRYLIEKERVAREVIGILEKRLGDIALKLEVYNVATPATYVRYTGNWKGSMEGWLPTPKTVGTTFKKTLPGLRDFYMAGQWVEPGGGLPPCAASGRTVAALVCRSDGKEFRAVADAESGERK